MHAAAKDAGLKLIVGAEITPEDTLPVVLWATDRAAYGRLARLITADAPAMAAKRENAASVSTTLPNTATAYWQA